MKIYTKSGDKGKTSLFDGSRVEKSDERIELLGELDELNSRVGILMCSEQLTMDNVVKDDLRNLQNNIFDLGSEIANPKFDSSKLKDFSINTSTLEQKMDAMDKELEELSNFILPGGSEAGSLAHLCRTQARKCERLFVKLQIVNSESDINDSIGPFLNRLSDYFFVLARFLNKKSGFKDIVWTGKE